MKCLLALLLLACLVWPLRAQTNTAPSTNLIIRDCVLGSTSNISIIAPQIRTNILESAPNFRRVNGQLYNTQRSQLWQTITGTVESKRDGILFVTTYKERHYSYGRPAATYNQSIGAYSAGPSVTPSDKVKEYGRTIAITNIPDYAALVDGQDIETELMKVGVLEDKDTGHTLELWDRGTLNRATVITTNTVTKSKK